MIQYLVYHVDKRLSVVSADALDHFRLLAVDDSCN